MIRGKATKPFDDFGFRPQLENAQKYKPSGFECFAKTTQ